MTALTIDRPSVGLDPLRDISHREARAARELAGADGGAVVMNRHDADSSINQHSAAQDRGQGAPTPDGVERGLERSSIHAPDNAAAYSSGHDYKLGRAPVDAQQTSAHPGLGIECLSPALPAPSAAQGREWSVIYPNGLRVACDSKEDALAIESLSPGKTQWRTGNAQWHTFVCADEEAYGLNDKTRLHGC